MSNHLLTQKPRAKSKKIIHPVVASVLAPKVKEANEEAKGQGSQYAVMMTESACLYCPYCGAESDLQNVHGNIDVYVYVYVDVDV